MNSDVSVENKILSMREAASRDTKENEIATNRQISDRSEIQENTNLVGMIKSMNA